MTNSILLLPLMIRGTMTNGVRLLPTPLNVNLQCVGIHLLPIPVTMTATTTFVNHRLRDTVILGTVIVSMIRLVCLVDHFQWMVFRGAVTMSMAVDIRGMTVVVRIESKSVPILLLYFNICVWLRLYSAFLVLWRALYTEN